MHVMPTGATLVLYAGLDRADGVRGLRLKSNELACPCLDKYLHIYIYIYIYINIYIYIHTHTHMKTPLFGLLALGLDFTVLMAICVNQF
jgi:hypothetical protein